MEVVLIVATSYRMMEFFNKKLNAARTTVKRTHSVFNSKEAQCSQEE